MDSTSKVILVLQLLVNLGPLAVYFVILGLLNSQRRPRLVSSRTDFITLTVVFLPVLISPLPFLVEHHLWWLLGTGSLAAIGAFSCLLPRRYAGWVIYHTTEDEVRAMLKHAMRRLGLAGDWQDSTLDLPEQRLRVRLSPFPWLGSVSLHLDSQLPGDAGITLALQAQVEQQLHRRVLLPSPVGACLVLVGLALGCVPLWMMFRHMDAIVDVVRDLLPA